jgi:hypothetical protein
MAQDKSPDRTGPGQAGDGEDMPLPRSVVVLKAAVYLMGIVLVAGFALLVYTLVTRVSQTPVAQLDEAGAAQQVRLAPGETIQSLSLDRNLLALQVKRPDGTSVILIHDISRGETVRQIEVKAE